MKTMDAAKQNWQSRMNRPSVLRAVIAFLLAVIAFMFVLWQPWGNAQSDQTIDVTGRAILTATPDQFVFRLSYQFKNTDKQAALDETEKKRGEMVAGLTELGVPSRNIKTSTDSYDRPLRDGVSDETTSTLSLTVVADGEKLVQSVQDYLLAASPAGSVSPQPYFSEQKQEELESQARDIATKDARANAEQTAQSWGHVVGKVKRVSDWYAFGLPPAWSATPAEQKQTLLPGENEITYTVNISFYLE